VVFFLDENSGFHVRSGNRLFRTSDGGQNWSGVTGATPGEIRFADPEVGWSFLNYYSEVTFSYTTDAGKRWASLRIPFPTAVTGFSLPRRDRGYVVGDHGMIYRYRVVPVTEEVAKAFPAPAMPIFNSPLDDQVEQLAEEITALQDSVKSSADTGQAEGVTSEVAPESKEKVGWAETRFAERVQETQFVLDALTVEIPQFSGKLRNLNLVFQGLQLVGQLFGQSQGLQESFNTFRKARGVQSAKAALIELSNQVEGLASTANKALQKPAGQQEEGKEE
jgi:hypothetical protein